jgi:hypothetical protein
MRGAGSANYTGAKKKTPQSFRHERRPEEAEREARILAFLAAHGLRGETPEESCRRLLLVSHPDKRQSATVESTKHRFGASPTPTQANSADILVVLEVRAELRAHRKMEMKERLERRPAARSEASGTLQGREERQRGSGQENWTRDGGEVRPVPEGCPAKAYFFTSRDQWTFFLKRCYSFLPFASGPVPSGQRDEPPQKRDGPPSVSFSSPKVTQHPPGRAPVPSAVAIAPLLALVSTIWLSCALSAFLRPPLGFLLPLCCTKFVLVPTLCCACTVAFMTPCSALGEQENGLPCPATRAAPTQERELTRRVTCGRKRSDTPR